MVMIVLNMDRFVLNMVMIVLNMVKIVPNMVMIVLTACNQSITDMPAEI